MVIDEKKKLFRDLDLAKKKDAIIKISFEDIVDYAKHVEQKYSPRYARRVQAFHALIGSSPQTKHDTPDFPDGDSVLEFLKHLRTKYLETE